MICFWAIGATEGQEHDLLGNNDVKQQIKRIRSWLDNMPELYKTQIAQYKLHLKFAEEELGYQAARHYKDQLSVQ
jgi:hypothetical protein